MRVETFADGDADDLAMFVEDDAAFGEVEGERVALVAGVAEEFPAGP